MPFYLADLALMAVQINTPFSQVFVQATIADLPDFNSCVLGAGGDFIVVEGVPF